MNIRHVRFIAALSAFCLAAIVFLTGVWAFFQPLEFDRRLEWAELKIIALLPQAPHPEFVPTPLIDYELVRASFPTVESSVPTITSTLPAVSSTLPRPTATRRPAPSSTPAAALPPRVALSNFRHEYQRFNNCGPATLGIWLSHFGRSETQYDLAPILKGSKDDRNVSPEELAALAGSNGFKTLVRVNGDANTLKALLAQGIPVLVENWFVPRPADASGHYRLLTGYDDTGTASTRGVGLSVEFAGNYPATESGYFIAQDSYIGPNTKLPYRAWDRDWRVFNRTYLVFYKDAQASVVKSIVGEDMSDAVMYASAQSAAQRDIDANTNDGYAWFNLGSSLAALGKYESAGRAFDRARQLKLPWRMMWYQFGPYESYLKSGRYEEAIALADATLVNYPLSEEALYYRGLAQLALGRKDAARLSFQKALEANTRFIRAKQALEGMGS